MDSVNSGVPSLIKLGNGLHMQIGTATFTTTATQVSAYTKLTTLLGGSCAFPTGATVTANDNPSVTLGAISSDTVTITRVASGTSGLTVGYILIGRIDTKAA